MENLLRKAKRCDNNEWVTGYYASDGKRHYIVTEIKDTNHIIYGHYSSNVIIYCICPETLSYV